MNVKDTTLLKLVELRESLKKILKPNILNKLADFIEATGGDKSNIERYNWFCHNSTDGVDCKYAKISKDMFYKNEADKVAKLIIWLYRNFAQYYEK